MVHRSIEALILIFRIHSQREQGEKELLKQVHCVSLREQLHTLRVGLLLDKCGVILGKQ